MSTPDQPTTSTSTSTDTTAKDATMSTNPVSAETVHPKVAMVRQAKTRLDDVREITEVDMGSVLDLLAECTRVAEQIDAVRIPIDDRQKSMLQGEMSRSMNRLADMLSAASAEAKMAYWYVKGYTDPRD